MKRVVWRLGFIVIASTLYGCGLQPQVRVTNEGPEVGLLFGPHGTCDPNIKEKRCSSQNLWNMFEDNQCRKTN